MLVEAIRDPDYLEYLLRDGSRALTANWNAGSFDITAANFFVGDDGKVGNAAYFQFHDDVSHITTPVGIQLGLGITPTQALTIGSNDGTDYVAIYHDNADAWIKWDDGNLAFQTDEGTNSQSNVFIIGKGTGAAKMNLRSGDGRGAFFFNASTTGAQQISGTGSAGVSLAFQPDAAIPVTFYQGTVEGGTQGLEQSGFRTGDQKRTFVTTVGKNADDQVTLDGVSHIFLDANARVKSLSLTSTTELTISSGAVTVTQGHHNIDTEGDAANDDLDTINGGNPNEILFLLPNNDDRTVRIRHGVGNIFLKHQVESKSYSFSSPAGSSGTFYSGGYYNWSSTDGNLTQASPSVTHSAANSASACHIGIVAGGAGTVDTGVVKITVSGTTITDDGVRAGSQTVDLVADITALTLNQYVETTEKWIGQVTIALATASGSPVNFNVDVNYGCSKYDDFGNQAFTINVLECVGLAGANDTGFNLRLFHHSSADWTYAATGFVPGGTVLASMNTDYSPEQNLSNGESFAYKRVNLNTDILGDDSEGLVLEITTSANKSVEIMDIHFGVHTAPNFSYMATTKQHLIFMKHGSNWLEL